MDSLLAKYEGVRKEFNDALHDLIQAYSLRLSKLGPMDSRMELISQGLHISRMKKWIRTLRSSPDMHLYFLNIETEHIIDIRHTDVTDGLMDFPHRWFFQEMIQEQIDADNIENVSFLLRISACILKNLNDIRIHNTHDSEEVKKLFVKYNARCVLFDLEDHLTFDGY